ncbi:hypothetical protein [Rhodoferax sp.]|nr:hypothetical protein [Rhodoferax sp.]
MGNASTVMSPLTAADISRVSKQAALRDAKVLRHRATQPRP